MNLQRRWPHIVQEMYHVLESELRRAAEADAGTAHATALRLTTAICDHIGGTLIYIPKGGAVRRSMRDALIRKQCHTHSIEQLARKYQLTQIRIRQILATQE